ncbi:hypothetical protein GQ53DRAFT_765272 [Thozetella sp. PMI_491]|nr:hypothetical protein GQ53DRAFT_765272 [Thozetella sp. PMI_491]
MRFLILGEASPWLIAFCVGAVALYSYRLIVPRRKRLATATDTVHDWTTLDFSATQPITPDFNWQDVPERPYRPWHNGPHNVTMGLQKTHLDDWVQIDKSYLARYQYKRKLFAQYPEETIQSLPRSEEPAFEALGYLAEFLPQRYPSMFVKTACGLDNRVTGDSWDLRRDSKTWSNYHPLQRARTAFPVGSSFVLFTPLPMLISPAGWQLKKRMGHSLWEIHAGKVPMYEKVLSRSMDRFFIRLRADKPFMRFNYAIDISSELFHINSHHNLTEGMLDKPVTLDQLHLRVERQVVQRLPRSRAIAFSIRTYVTPITEVTRDKEVAIALRTSVGSYSPALAVYKNKPLWERVLADHFRDILGEEFEDIGL